MSSGRFRVLIAGGGVAGLEALMALRDMAGDRVDLTLLAPEAEFVYRPMAVAEPFGRGHADRHPLAEIASEFEAELIQAALVEVDPAGRAAVTGPGQRVAYDALLVAVGARSEPALRRALTWTPETDAELFGGLLRDLDEGYLKRVAFVVPPGVAWALPAYELAMMTAWQAWGMGHDDIEVTVYTPEDAPLGLFGTRGTAALREDLEEAGVRAETGVYVTEDPPSPAGWFCSGRANARCRPRRRPAACGWTSAGRTSCGRARVRAHRPVRQGPRRRGRVGGWGRDRFSGQTGRSRRSAG